MPRSNIPFRTKEKKKEKSHPPCKQGDIPVSIKKNETKKKESHTATKTDRERETKTASLLRRYTNLLPRPQITLYLLFPPPTP